MKQFLTMLFVSFTLVSFTQNFYPVYIDTARSGYELILEGSGEFASTSLSNDFSFGFWRGENLNETKDHALARHKDVNRWGIRAISDLRFHLYDLKLFNNKNWGLSFNAGYGGIASMHYSKDLFGLVFYGNKNYIGDTAYVGSAAVSILSYQKVGFGLIDAKSGNRLSINAVGITDYSKARLIDTYLYQNDDVTELAVSMNGNYQKAIDSLYYKGFGVTIDAEFNLPIVIRDNPSTIQLRVDNLGFGYIPGNTINYSLDTTINYDGFSFRELIDQFSGSTEEQNYLDSLGLVRDTIQDKSFMFPMVVQVGKLINQNSLKKFDTFFGFRLYQGMEGVPMAFCGGQYKINQHIIVGLNASYGGFAKFRAGIYTMLNFDQFDFIIGSDDLYGFLPQGFGQTINTRLRWRI